MTVWNPNIPLNSNNEKKEQRTKQYGQRSASSATRLHRLQLAKSPALDVAIKVLIICMIIDIPILGYFYIVKGVGMWEGLQQIRKEIQAERQMAEKKEPIQVKNIENKFPPTNQQSVSFQSQKIEPAKEKEAPKSNPLYSWKKENGYRGYSNVGFPTDEKYTDPQIIWQ